MKTLLEFLIDKDYKHEVSIEDFKELMNVYNAVEADENERPYLAKKTICFKCKNKIIRHLYTVFDKFDAEYYNIPNIHNMGASAKIPLNKFIDVDSISANLRKLYVVILDYSNYGFYSVKIVDDDYKQGNLHSAPPVIHIALYGKSKKFLSIKFENENYDQKECAKLAEKFLIEMYNYNL